MPQKLVKQVYFSRDGIFLKCPKIEEFHFRFLFCFKIDHMFFSKCPTFLFSKSDRENGPKKRTYKIGAFRKKTRDQLKGNRKSNFSIMGHLKNAYAIT